MRYKHKDGSWADYPEHSLTHIDGSSQHGTFVFPTVTVDKHEYGLPNLETKGKKFDSEKVPLDLIPHDSLLEIGKVLQAGEKKYGTANWANGIEIRRLLSAAMRHIGQFNNGEDIDEETQTLHIANAATNLLFAIWMMKNKPEMDNRWIKGIKK